EQGTGQPGEAAAVEVGRQVRAANQGQIHQAAQQEIAGTAQEPEIAVPLEVAVVFLPRLDEQQQPRDEEEEGDRVPVTNAEEAAEFEEKCDPQEQGEIKPARGVGQLKLEK